LTALSTALVEKERELEVLEKKEEAASSGVADLARSLDSLLAIYDITKELSRSQEKEQILGIFKDRLMKDMELEDCRIVDRAIKQEGIGYKLYPIKIDDKSLRYLAIKNSGSLDENLLAITLNQLALALRRVSLYREVEELSITDGLTGIYNRRHFTERSKQEFARAGNFKLNLSFLMLDIDYFKSYNDTFGHIVGDMLLRKVAEGLKAGLRQIDMYARWGGEEFCILLPDTPKDGAYQVAERLRSGVEQLNIKAYDENFKVTISIGVASYPEDAKEYSLLVDKADEALYNAKKAGRNTVFVYGMHR